MADPAKGADPAAELNVLKAARQWIGRDDQVVMATVIDTWGSAPVPVGGQMAVAADGGFQGSVSGGCIEGEVIVEAEETLKSGKPQNETKHGRKGVFEELYSELPRLEQFMGAIIGDHVKTAICTRIMTGVVVHTGAMLAQTAAVTGCIARFAWCTDEGVQPFRLSKFVEVATAMMGRRGLRPSPAYLKRLEGLHASVEDKKG